jgi:tetratricopeptide (TPR) repeat protein
LGTRDFAVYPRSAALLSHVVEETLAGRGEAIKESTLGVEVFGREPGYDSKADSVVRTQARRVREKLGQYYSTEGRLDPVLIEIPKGGYVPQFRLAQQMVAREREDAPSARRNSNIAWVTAALVGIAVGGVAIGMRKQVETPPRLPTMAVLPFVDLDAKHRFDALAYGMAEDVERDLSRVQELRLHSGPPGTSGEHRSDYRALAVDAVLDGQVASEGNRGEIRVSLIRTADNSILWTDHFPSNAPVGGVERQIEENVARALHVKLAAGPSRPENPKAHDLFFAGRTLWATRDPAKTKEAIGFFEKAVHIDPDYALAYMGIADAYALMAANDQIETKLALDRGFPAVRKALELDPSLAEAHSALGMLLCLQGHRKEGAAEYQRAIELNPSYDRAYVRAGTLRFSMGDFPGAERLIRQAETLNPYAMSLPLIRAELYYYWRRYNDSEDLIRTVLKADPKSVAALQILARDYLEQNQPRKALEAERKVVAIDPKSLQLQCELASYLYRSGETSQAAETAQGVLGLEASDPLALAVMYARMGDKAKTLHYLEMAQAAHEGDIGSISWEPAMDFLRADPRFLAVQRSVASIN